MKDEELLRMIQKGDLQRYDDLLWIFTIIFYGDLPYGDLPYGDLP